MIGICFDWNPPAAIRESPFASKKWFTQWTHTAKAFKVESLFVRDKTKRLKRHFFDAEINTQIIDSHADIEYPLVQVEPGGQTLEIFTHPINCVYVFGDDYARGVDRLKGAPLVSIPSAIPLYAVQACAMVLYDRSTKWP